MTVLRRYYVDSKQRTLWQCIGSDLARNLKVWERGIIRILASKYICLMCMVCAGLHII